MPRVQGTTPPPRDPGRHDRRQEHRRSDGPADPRRARVRGRHGPQRTRGDDRGPVGEGDPGAARVPRRRRAGLPHARPRGGHPGGRRGPADPSGHADRQRTGGGPLHPGRAIDRPAPAGQPTAPRHADPSPRPREHPDRRRARRGDDRGGRSHRRHRAGRGRARRARRVFGRSEGTPRVRGVDDRRVPVRAPDGPGPRGPATTERSADPGSRASASTTSGTSPPTSRSGCSSASPVCRAAASPRSCRTCCCGR